MVLEKKDFKIGIVTFFYANNYGAVLQAFALQIFLRDNGYESEFVNYIPNEKLSVKQKIKEIVKFLIDKKNKQNQFDQIFKKFIIENLIISEKISTRKKLNQISYDLIIASSDQIWNTKLNKENTSYFLLDFAKKDIKRISYASCIGQPEQIEKFMYLFESQLTHFDKISVRNEFSKNFIDKFGVNSFVVCDPTLLIDFEKFDKEYSLPFKEYILVYSLNMKLESLLNDTLNQLQEKYNLPIVILNSKYKVKIHFKHISIDDATPQQWVWLFKNASYVLTDSFHGVIFSIKFEKNFLALHGNDWRSFRLLDIVKKYCCENRCVCNVNENDWIDSPIDYKTINKFIDVDSKKSKEYLFSSLKVI